MTDAAPLKRASLSQETWKELVATRKTWGPWVLGVAILLAVIRLMMPEIVAVDPVLAKQNPMLVWRSLTPLFPYGIANAVLSFVATYVFAVIYLQHVAAANPPQLSVGGFFFWLGRYLARTLRPILWLLLPIIGFYFYIRSIIRRTTVTPMAVLGQKDIMQRSWDLTQGHVWRIIWHGLVITVKVTFFAVLFSLAVYIVIGIPAYFMHANFLYILTKVSGVLAGIITSILIMAYVIYSCTVMRILLKEKKAASSTTTLSAAPESV